MVNFEKKSHIGKEGTQPISKNAATFWRRRPIRMQDSSHMTTKPHDNKKKQEDDAMFCSATQC